MITLSKLNRPPAVENWSRMQHPELGKTTRKTYGFISGGPVWNYMPARRCAMDSLTLGLDRETALKAVRRAGNKLGRSYNADLIEAWFDYLALNPMDGVPLFAGLVERFPLGPGLEVPVKPTSVVRDRGSFSPIFMVPWSDFALDDYQVRLFMTILEMSIFRQSDFEDSPGKVLFFPKQEEAGKVWRRRPRIIERGQYNLLSKDEVDEQVRIYLESCAAVKERLIREGKVS